MSKSWSFEEYISKNFAKKFFLSFSLPSLLTHTNKQIFQLHFFLQVIL
jgi:hypothetical protein